MRNVFTKVPAPESGEYGDFYEGYVELARGSDVASLLAGQVPALRRACDGLSDSAALARYAPGKWSVKEVVGHLADSDRVFSYRLLRIGRGDSTPLSSFDENFFVERGGFDDRPLTSLLDELEAVRAATIHLVAGLAPDSWTRRGLASGKEVTARAIAHIIAGHAEHHLVILRERYGLAVPLTQ